MHLYYKLPLFFLFFISITQAGCTKETDDGGCKNASIQPKLVINSFLSVKDSIHLHASQSGTKCGIKPSILENADIGIYLGEHLITKFTHSLAGFYKPTNSPVFLYDVNYRVEAKAPNLKPVISYQSIPQPTNFNISTSEIKESNGKSFFECSINFNDNVAQTNYYMISIFKLDSIPDPVDSLKYHHIKHRLAGLTKDLSVQKPFDDLKQDFYGAHFLLNDVLFNGQNHQTNITISAPEPISIGHFNIMVELKTLTEDHFKHIFSKEKNKAAADNPFAQPVQIYSNIKNGFGIFGGYSTVQKRASVINANS